MHKLCTILQHKTLLVSSILFACVLWCYTVTQNQLPALCDGVFVFCVVLAISVNSAKGNMFLVCVQRI